MILRGRAGAPASPSHKAAAVWFLECQVSTWEPGQEIDAARISILPVGIKNVSPAWRHGTPINGLPPRASASWPVGMRDYLERIVPLVH